MKLFCQLCSLYLGTADADCKITCPLCVELRQEMQQEVGGKYDPDYDAIGWEFQVDRAIRVAWKTAILWRQLIDADFTVKLLERG